MELPVIIIMLHVDMKDFLLDQSQNNAYHGQIVAGLNGNDTIPFLYEVTRNQNNGS